MDIRDIIMPGRIARLHPGTLMYANSSSYKTSSPAISSQLIPWGEKLEKQPRQFLVLTTALKLIILTLIILTLSPPLEEEEEKVNRSREKGGPEAVNDKRHFQQKYDFSGA